MASLEILFDALLESVSWNELRTASGNSVEAPNALRQLTKAQSEQDVDDAYWKLDNQVIVQGRMFNSAASTIVPIGVALGIEGLHPEAMYRLMELLTEFALGVGHEDEADPAAIKQAIQAELTLLTTQLYELSQHKDARIRLDALEILRTIETGSPRFNALISLLLSDPDENVRKSALEG